MTVSSTSALPASTATSILVPVPMSSAFVLVLWPIFADQPTFLSVDILAFFEIPDVPIVLANKVSKTGTLADSVNLIIAVLRFFDDSPYFSNINVVRPRAFTIISWRDW
jgi:hypothetical protein